MGVTASTNRNSYIWSTDTRPLDQRKPEEWKSRYDPMLGFPNGRKERVMIATQEEMESAGFPMEDRDYCAHLYLQAYACRTANFPFIYKCKPEVHEYMHCQIEDKILRMKEYEREKRLMALEKKQTRREERKKAREAREARENLAP